jgi:flavin-dependent dehydrogenase
LTIGWLNPDIDFLTTDPNNYSWNVIRSESDLIMLRHAAKCGAKVFEGVKVQSVEFSSSPVHDAGSGEIPDNPGYPVSAFYVRKGDGSSGTIGFKYIVDASGRTGLVSTKYMKNRQFYEPLKNVASWGYWRGARTYAAGTERENAPYFEALQGASIIITVVSHDCLPGYQLIILHF